MRCVLSFALGILELAVASILLALGLLLPAASDVRQNFNRIEHVADRSEKQVQALREQVGTVRDPKVQQFLADLGPHLPRLKERLKGDVSFESAREVSQSLGTLARAMEEWANSLDPALVKQLSDGTLQLASFLDDSVATTASTSAARLEKTTAALRKDAEVLTRLLKDAPPDLKAARDIHEGLLRFSEGLDKVSVLMDPERLKAMREGFKGMETSLETGAVQVDKLASYTYPVVKLNGFKPPTVDDKSFWPEGEKIAEGMRKGAKALKAAGKELDAQAVNLPQVQKSLDESRKSVARTRDALGRALKDHDKLEAVLKSIPRSTARLAQELPTVSADLARVLREAERLKEVAAGLRQTHKNMASAVAKLPKARQGLRDSAARLRDLQARLDSLQNVRSQETLQRTVELADAAAQVVPLLAARLERLDTPHQGLAALSDNLGEVRDSLPGMADSTVTFVTLLRWLLWCVGLLVAVHAATQFLAVRRQGSTLPGSNGK
jgi:DNA repair exonuclease SbcCD ATPase subunit